MDKLLKSVEPYARMIGVIAAAIVLGAWMVQNMLVENARSLRDAITKAEAQYAAAMRDQHLESRQLEIYQIAASARKYAAIVARREGTLTDVNGDLSDALEGMEEVHVTREFVRLLSDLHRNSDEFLAAIGPSAPVSANINRLAAETAELLVDVDMIHASFEARRAEILGDSEIELDAVSPTKQGQLSNAIATAREASRALTPRWLEVSNSSFRAFDQLFAEAKANLVSRKRNADLARSLQFGLYILGSIVAIGGAFVSARKDIRDAQSKQVDAVDIRQNGAENSPEPATSSAPKK